MPTTTNYGWTTPADTDLVKDGASAIRTLGTSIDTTVFNNAGAAIPKTLIDAKGDLIVGSAADTAARLAAGTNGYLLSANSSATNGLEWVAAPTSGGITLISTTTLSGASTTISSIPGTYNSLFLVITGVTGNTNNRIFRIMFNGSTNAQSYSTVYNASVYNVTNGRLNTASPTLRTNADNAFALTINNYASSTTFKPFIYYGRYVTSASANETNMTAGGFTDVTAISSIVFDYEGTDTFAGGTVLLYGVK